MKAQIFTTIAADGTKTTYFEDAKKHFICHDLNDAINTALYYGYMAKYVKNNVIYFEK